MYVCVCELHSQLVLRECVFICLPVQEVDNLLLELAATYQLADERMLSLLTHAIDVSIKLLLIALCAF